MEDSGLNGSDPNAGRGVCSAFAGLDRGHAPPRRRCPALPRLLGVATTGLLFALTGGAEATPPETAPVIAAADGG